MYCTDLYLIIYSDFLDKIRWLKNLVSKQTRTFTLHSWSFGTSTKKALTKVKAFNNLFILLYRDFVDKIDEICVVQNFLEWGVQNALRSDKKFETSKDRNFSTKAQILSYNEYRHIKIRIIHIHFLN